MNRTRLESDQSSEKLKRNVILNGRTGSQQRTSLESKGPYAMNSPNGFRKFFRGRREAKDRRPTTND